MLCFLPASAWFLSFCLSVREISRKVMNGFWRFISDQGFWNRDFLFLLFIFGSIVVRYTENSCWFKEASITSVQSTLFQTAGCSLRLKPNYIPSTNLQEMEMSRVWAWDTSGVVWCQLRRSVYCCALAACDQSRLPQCRRWPRALGNDEHLDAHVSSMLNIVNTTDTTDPLQTTACHSVCLTASRTVNWPELYHWCKLDRNLKKNWISDTEIYGLKTCDKTCDKLRYLSCCQASRSDTDYSGPGERSRQF